MTSNTLWGTVLDGWNGHLFISVYSVNPGVPMEAVWVISRSDRDRAASLPVHSRSIWHTITSMTQTSRQVQQEPLTVSVDDCRIRVQTGEPIIFVDVRRGRRTGLPAPRRSPGPCASSGNISLTSTLSQAQLHCGLLCLNGSGNQHPCGATVTRGRILVSGRFTWRVRCLAAPGWPVRRQRRLSEIEKAWASDEQLATV